MDRQLGGNDGVFHEVYIYIHVQMANNNLASYMYVWIIIAS